MNQNRNLPIKIGLMSGAALGIVVISIGIIRYKTGMILRGDQRLSYLYWVIFTLTVISLVFRFKKLQPALFSLKQSIKIGLFAGLISGLMYTLYIVILNNWFDTELSSKIIRFNEQAIVSTNPELSKEDAAQSIKTMQMSSLLRGSIYTLVCMSFGVIHSIIGTAVARKITR